MTRRIWEKKTIREAERALGVPAGWWGAWRDEGMLRAEAEGRPIEQRYLDANEKAEAKP